VAQDLEPIVRIVHQGRGGHVEIEGARYPIDHVSEGRFVIQFPAGNRHPRRDAHRAALAALVADDPEKWALEDRSRGPRRGAARTG